MPDSPHPLLVDGRQSEAASRIQRGVRRMFFQMRVATLTETPLPGGRRADILALKSDGALSIVEIKSGPADFYADQKWPDYHAHCDHFYFAVAPDFPQALLPEETGLIVADAYGAAILREGPARRLAPATRRALTMRFATIAADRLHALADPGRGLGDP